MIPKTSIALGLLLLAASGCAEPPHPVVVAPAPSPLPGMTKDTATIHNADATRIWIVRSDGGMNGGEQRVIFCDAAMLQTAGHPLCVFWPPVSAPPAAPPR